MAVLLLSNHCSPSLSRSSFPNGIDAKENKNGVIKPNPKTDKWTRYCISKRHWKQGEFPGITGATIPRKPPIKNIKKKLEKKAKAKAWANTVTEQLSELIEKKRLKEALDVFEMLRRQPFYRPIEGTYLKLLVLSSRSCQPDLARHLFDQMLLDGLPATPALYTAFLSAYSRNSLLPEAFGILEKMKALPLCQPDVFTYSTLIKGCVDAERFDLLPDLYSDMSGRGITPNTVTQNTVLAGYGRAGLYDQMEEVLSQMLQENTAKPDSWTMNIFLSIFGNKGKVNLMEKWYEKFRDFGIEPDIRTFNILIGAYGKLRMYDKMSSVMEYMRKLQFPWTTSTYNNIIEAFADAGDAKLMEYTVNQMRSERMRFDSKTLTCLVNGYAKAGMFHKVMASVKLAAELDVPFTTSFYNAVILACAVAGDLIEMERVFNRMKGGDFPPDSSTYGVMIKAYRNVGMNDKAFDLEQELKSSNSVPSITGVVSGAAYTTVT